MLICFLGLAAFMIGQSGGWGAGGENGGGTAPGFLGTTGPDDAPGPSGPGQQPGGKPSWIPPSAPEPSDGGGGPPGGDGPDGSGGGAPVPGPAPPSPVSGVGVSPLPKSPPHPQVGVCPDYEVEVEQDTFYVAVRDAFHSTDVVNANAQPGQPQLMHMQNLAEKTSDILKTAGAGALRLKKDVSDKDNAELFLTYFTTGKEGVLQNKKQMNALAAVWEKTLQEKVNILSKIKALFPYIPPAPENGVSSSDGVKELAVVSSDRVAAVLPATVPGAFCSSDSSGQRLQQRTSELAGDIAAEVKRVCVGGGSSEVQELANEVQDSASLSPNEDNASVSSIGQRMVGIAGEVKELAVVSSERVEAAPSIHAEEVEIVSGESVLLKYPHLLVHRVDAKNANFGIDIENLLK